MRFGRWLAVIVAAGVALRVVYVLHVVQDLPLGADALWYQLQGAIVRGGHGYLDPASFFQGRHVATATFPPLYPAFLAAVSWVTSSATTTLRLWGALPAVATMVLTALLARRVLGDDRVALLAASIVAVSPLVAATDMSLMSESLSVPLALLALLLVHRLVVRGNTDPGDRSSTWHGPATGGAALVGVVTGVGMLARNDVAAVAVVAAVLVLATARVGWRRILATLAVVGVAAGVVVAPWVVRNARVLDEPTLTTTSFSTALAGANCPATYEGELLGAWAFDCISVEERTSDNETEYSDTLVRRAVDHVTGNAGRVPVVVGARVLRLWGAWDPVAVAELESVESRRYGWQLAGWGFASAVIVAAGAGAVLLRRRRIALATLAAPLVAVTATAVLTYGSQRFRAPAEPVLAILAAHALVTLTRRRRATAA